MHKKGIYEKYLKRPFDLFVALTAFIILFPLLFIFAVLIRIKLGSPIIFKQKRPGLDEKIFTLYKFRTMTDKKNELGILLPDSERLTKFGKFLRSTSIDELPSLINIIKGELSIVGPRPQLIEDMLFMTDVQRNRHKVKPGLTGLSQVSGRNNLSWEVKLAIDLKYVNEISFSIDILIILKTIYKVIVRENVSAAGMETAENLSDYLLRTGKIVKEDYLNKMIELRNFNDM